MASITGGRDAVDRTVSIDDRRSDPTRSRSGVTGTAGPRVDQVAEVEETVTREAVIVTPEGTFKEVDVKRVAYATRSRPLTTIKKVNQPYQTRLKISPTGDYIQFSYGRMLGGVLDSLDDGLLYIQNFTMTRQSSPRVNPEFLFCCRIFVEKDGRYWFLSYINNADSGAGVQFQPFRKDEITEGSLDGRIFVRRKNGNYSLFGSFFNSGLYMCYDKRSKNLLMKTIKSLSRVRREFLFSETTFGTNSRPRRSVPAKILTGMRRRLSCVGISDTGDESDTVDGIVGQFDAIDGQLGAIDGQLEVCDGETQTTSKQITYRQATK